MKRSLLAGALALAALTNALSRDSGSSLEAAILGIEHQADDAALKGDVAATDRLLADDFIGIGPHGGIMTKAAVLDRLRTGKFRYESIKRSDLKVRFLGKIAIVTGIGDVAALLEGNRVSVRYRYTRLWLKKQRTWQVVSFQATPLKARPASDPRCAGTRL